VDAPRVRFGVALEWALAAGGILALLALGSLAVRELRGLRAVPSVMAGERPGQPPPAVVVPGAVSVPILILSTGVELRVGERASSVHNKIDPDWQVGPDAVERTRTGERVIRRYDDGATPFTLVFEPDAEEDARLGGIYVR
jgi:hypothetical protein